MDVDNEIISQFLTGTVAVFALIAIGGAMAGIFRTISRQFAFTRMALVLALPPFCLSKCIDRSSLSTLFLFAIVIIVLGFTIDAIKYLFLSRDGKEGGPAKKTKESETDGKGVVWEKAE